MMLRIRSWDNENDKNKLLAVQKLNDSDISETFKILDYMRQNEIPLRVTHNVADSDEYEEYLICELSMEFDEKFGEEQLLPCIAVDCV